MQTASTWRYPPPKLNGRPVYAFTVMTVNFSTMDEGPKTTVTFQ